MYQSGGGDITSHDPIVAVDHTEYIQWYNTAPLSAFAPTPIPLIEPPAGPQHNIIGGPSLNDVAPYDWLKQDACFAGPWLVVRTYTIVTRGDRPSLSSGTAGVRADLINEPHPWFPPRLPCRLIFISLVFTANLVAHVNFCLLFFFFFLVVSD